MNTIITKIESSQEWKNLVTLTNKIASEKNLNAEQHQAIRHMALLTLIKECDWIQAEYAKETYNTLK